MSERRSRTSYRSAESQAKRAVSRVLALNQARHGALDDGLIHSVGTARSYQQALTGAARWMQAQNDYSGLKNMSVEKARAYLEFRADQVGQKALDLDRQALCELPDVDGRALARVQSQVDGSGQLARQSRTYTREQRQLVYADLKPDAAFAAKLIYATGLRAHELNTLRPIEEQPVSNHRQWSPDRFAGRREWCRYSVTGKGGLTREVAIPPAHVERLEAQRLTRPQRITDRNVSYVRHYKLPAGKTLSSAWSAASQQALGWSTGIHGLRHNYAQQRMQELQSLGYHRPDAKLIVSQEMGHFRADVLDEYLR